MSAKLISYTSMKDQTIMDIICYCARVSNPANQELNQHNDKLIQYLIKNHHWSPFEMVSICLEITTTRDISRQILRHRSFSFQEFSQRYAKVEEQSIIREARLQDNVNRQNSIFTEDPDITDKWNQLQTKIKDTSFELYREALELGIAKEQARVLLPEGLTTTTLYMNGTLRSWIHYIELRSTVGTQKEHQLLAIECAKAIREIFPNIMNFVKA